MKPFAFLFLLFFTGTVVAQSDEAMDQWYISSEVDKIDREKGYTVKTLSNDYFMEKRGEMSDGGQELQGYYKGDTLKKISYRIGLSTQILHYDYYFNDSTLLYVYEKEENFMDIENEAGVFVALDYTKVKTGFEGHYYLKDNEIFFKEEYGKRRFGDEELTRVKQRIFDDIRVFIRDLADPDVQDSGKF